MLRGERSTNKRIGRSTLDSLQVHVSNPVACFNIFVRDNMTSYLLLDKKFVNKNTQRT